MTCLLSSALARSYDDINFLLANVLLRDPTVHLGAHLAIVHVTRCSCTLIKVRALFLRRVEVRSMGESVCARRVGCARLLGATQPSAIPTDILALFGSWDYRDRLRRSHTVRPRELSRGAGAKTSHEHQQWTELFE